MLFEVQAKNGEKHMEITAYVLITRDSSNNLKLASCRKSIEDIPVGFEPRYAEYMFEFAESRIHCQQSDEIMLAKGIVDTNDIEKHPDFIGAFKNRLRHHCDFENWEIIQSKQAMCVNGSVYRDKLLNHLRARHIIGFKRREDDHFSVAS